VRPRALRLLHAGGAPAGWLRQAGRAAARLGALDRAVAWTGEMARVSPSLRDAPLWGDTLGALALSLPARPSAAADDGGALPGGFPRRTASPGASPSPRTDAAPRSRPERRVPPPSRQRPTTAGRATSAPTIGPASRSAPDPASLPRRAAEGVLHQWNPEAGDGRTGSARRGSGTSPTSFGNGGGGAGAAWDQAAGRAPFIAAGTDGERRVWTPSPQALPILSVPDRLHGWAAGRARSHAAPEPAFARGEGDARWIAGVASAAARRLPFRSARMEDRFAMDAMSDVAASPSSPAADRRAAALADEWAWPLDGPTVAAEVLARLAARVRTPRPPSRPSGGRGSAAATDAPPAARRPSHAGERGGDDASAAVRRSPRIMVEGGEGASAALLPSPHPLFRPRRAAQLASDTDADRPASPFPPSIRPIAVPRGPATDVDAGHRSISRFPHAFRPRATSETASGDGWTNEDAGAGADAERAIDGEARDRWAAWPAVLPWPRREARGGGTATAPVARRSRDGDAGTAAEPPRLARSVAGEAPLPAAAMGDAARVIPRRIETSAPAARSSSAEDEVARDGWLIDTLRARSPQPGLSVEPGGATIPIHPAPEVEMAELRGGIPGVLSGAPPLPWMAGAGAMHEADALGELDALAGRVRRILEDEVRRHGIDV
jgi:hypothetical protein